MHLEKSTVSHLSLVMKSTTERLAASDKRHEELAKKLADTEAVLFASDTRQEELAKKLADTEEMLTMRKLELENVKRFLMLESRSSKQSLESSRFLRSMLVDKSECSIEASGTFFFMWKLKANRRASYSSQFYTGQPGWHLKLDCVPTIEKKLLRPTHMSVFVGTTMISWFYHLNHVWLYRSLW